MAETCRAPDAIEPNGALDPLAASLVTQAAKGDLSAQRRIREAWIDTLRPDQPAQANADLVAAGGLFVARLCAANGDATDASKLATLLLNVGIEFHNDGRISLGWELIAESLALFERLSTTGDVEAAAAVDALVPTLPPEVVERAQHYSRPNGRTPDVAPNP